MKTWAFLLVLLVIFVIVVYLKKQWTRRHYPPGPLALPVIGSMWLMVFGAYTETLIQLAKQYGNIYTIWMGHIPIVVLSGFQTVKEGLVDYSEEFSDRPQTPLFKFIGKENENPGDILRVTVCYYFSVAKGIAVSNGHIWKQHRRFVLVTLRKLGLGKRGVERQIEEEAQQLVETFARTKGQPFDPTTPIVKSVSNVICALTFGHPFSLEDKNFQKLIGAADNTLRFLGSYSHILYEMFPWLMKHLPGPHKKIISDTEEMFSFARKEIKNHKEQQSLHDPRDFIDFYLLEIEKRKNDPDSAFHEENLIQCIHDFFLAGSDTTVLSLKWALLLLTNHPDIQEKVYKEIEDVLGSSQSIAYQDVKRLPYTNAVIHEMQRFRFISLMGIPRQCAKDVNIHGFLIPKGTLILPNLRSVLLDPEQWESPEKFDPNHFLDKDGNFVAREAYLPFGAGARACPGEQLARIEIFIFLTSLLRTFHFQLPEGVEELNQDPVQGMTTPPHPYKICAVPCSNSV